eukprot:COSAG05_NODE_1136_length_5755_cov_4.734441_4_plen_196_part_00
MDPLRATQAVSCSLLLLHGSKTGNGPLSGEGLLRPTAAVDMSLTMQRGPIQGKVAVDPRDGKQYVVTDVDPSHRLPSKEDMESTADALLKPTLDELLERCIELGIADKDALKTTRMNVMLKKFTNKHYIQLWAERLAELDRMGLVSAQHRTVALSRPPLTSSLRRRSCRRLGAPWSSGRCRRASGRRRTSSRRSR